MVTSPVWPPGVLGQTIITAWGCFLIRCSTRFNLVLRDKKSSKICTHRGLTFYKEKYLHNMTLLPGNSCLFWMCVSRKKSLGFKKNKTAYLSVLILFFKIPIMAYPGPRIDVFNKPDCTYYLNLFGINGSYPYQILTFFRCYLPLDRGTVLYHSPLFNDASCQFYMKPNSSWEEITKTMEIKRRWLLFMFRNDQLGSLKR